MSSKLGRAILALTIVVRKFLRGGIAGCLALNGMFALAKRPPTLITPLLKNGHNFCSVVSCGMAKYNNFAFGLAWTARSGNIFFAHRSLI